MDLQHLSSTDYIILEEIMCQQFLVVLICLFMAIDGHSLRRQYRNVHEIRYRMSVRIPKVISHLNCIINDSDIVCIDKLKMDINAFHNLVLLTKDVGGLTDGKYMSSSEKLAMFLNILAHHEKNRSIKVDYIRSGWSVSQAFNECLRAILKLTSLFLVNPKPILEDEIEDRWTWFKWTTSHASKRSRNSTPSTRRTWTAAEERTLIDGLKELCVNGWRGDNGTFKPGYLKELECYLCEHHPNSGLKGEPHVLSKIRFWKKCNASIAMLKSQSGLGFQYGDGAIIVDDPKFWDDFKKVDPNAKNLNKKKWPMFVDWEEIFGKDRATGEFAEGPLDVVEEIQRSQSSVLFNDMSLGFPVDLDGDEEAGSSHRPNVTMGEAGNATGATTFLEASQNENAGAFEPEEAGSQQTNKQGQYTKRSSNVNEKEKCKKRKKIPENDSEIFLKGMVEIGNRDQSDLRDQIYSIIESPIFDLYSTEQRIKATMVLCDDVKKMELFIRMGELERQTMMFMIINDKL
ncbi:hypothetical protein H5410_046881 [Solanum commersonii]|uniref:DUF8040 domain-containing protein n=1 Tax=Solanum commersonii TaxID=4109 RepID=A0A9J5XFM7_SOLCO|nr:hypothetical protein H5410_046881 [Solanum commersonii]